LIQHVTAPTRNDAIFDLVFTDESDTIGDITSVGKLASSDHNLLLFDTVIYAKDTVSGEEIYDYKKGDYEGMRTELRIIDWDELLKGSVNEGCNKFKDVVQRVEKQYIPLHRRGGGKAKKAAWLTYKAFKLVKKSTEYIGSSRMSITQHMQRQPRKLHWNFTYLDSSLSKSWHRM